MRYDDIDPTLRAFLGNWEGFRKLGFRSDDLYCVVCMSGRLLALSCFVQLKAQGKEFLAECGLVTKSEEDWNRHYAEVSLAVNGHKVPQEDMDRIWQESEVHQNGANFVLALMHKGFKLPVVSESDQSRIRMDAWLEEVVGAHKKKAGGGRRRR